MCAVNPLEADVPLLLLTNFNTVKIVRVPKVSFFIFFLLTYILYIHYDKKYF